MSTLSRSMKNVFGKKVRTLVIVVIIGFSLGVFLTMSIVSENISGGTSDIAKHMERTAIVTSAGVDKGVAMNETNLANITAVKNVKSVQMMIIKWHFNETSPGVWVKGVVQGMLPDGPLMLQDGSQYKILSGRNLQASDTNNSVVLIGSRLTDLQGADLGASINLSDAHFEIVGIFSSSTTAGNSSAIVPYEAAKEAYNISGPHTVFVTADTVGHVDAMVNDLRKVLGDEFDVVGPGDQSDSVQESIDTIKANSQFGAFIALLTGIAVMVFIMILITRERTREIGILKAIGFRNSKIIAQLTTESMTLAALGFIVGLLLVVLTGPTLSSIMVEKGDLDALKSDGGKDDLGKGKDFDKDGGSASSTEVEFKLEPTLMLITLGMALLLGALGSLYPVLQAIRLKPAEALRYE